MLSGLTAAYTPPASTSNVVIAPAGGAAVTGPAAPVTIASLSLGNSADATSLALQNSGTMTVSGAATLNNNSTLGGTGSLVAGSFSVSGGSATLGGRAVVLSSGVSGAGTIYFNGGTLKASGDSSNFITAAGAVVQSGGATIAPNGYTVTIGQTLTHDASGPAIDGGLMVQGAGTVVVGSSQAYTGPTTVAGGTLKLLGQYYAPGLVAQFYGTPTDSTVQNVLNQGQGAYNSWLLTQPLYLSTTTVAASTAHPALAYPDYLNHFQDMGFNSSNPAIPANVDLNNNYTLSMTGKIDIATSGSYSFGTNSDDGSMLWIDGNLVVNNNNYQGMNEDLDPSDMQVTGQIDLTAGYHDIQIAYYEGGGGHGMNVAYNGPDTTNASGAPYGNNNGWIMLPNSVLSILMPGTTSDPLPTTTALRLAAGATFDLNGLSQQVASLADYSPGAGGSVINSSTAAASVLTLSPTGGSTTFSGQILGGGTLGTVSLVMSGSGTQDLAGTMSGPGSVTVLSGELILSGSNSYQGGTVVEGGLLVATQSSAIPQGTSLAIGAGGTFLFDPTATAGVAAGAAAAPAAGIAAVPEPGMLALLAATLLAAGIARRRRKTN